MLYVALKNVPHNLNTIKLNMMMKDICTYTNSEENTWVPQIYEIKIDVEIPLNVFGSLSLIYTK